MSKTYQHKTSNGIWEDCTEADYNVCHVNYRRIVELEDESYAKVLVSGRNWVEDFPEENGVYMNRCNRCNGLFLGYKRRIFCFKCANQSNERSCIV